MELFKEKEVVDKDFKKMYALGCINTVINIVVIVAVIGAIFYLFKVVFL